MQPHKCKGFHGIGSNFYSFIQCCKFFVAPLSKHIIYLRFSIYSLPMPNPRVVDNYHAPVWPVCLLIRCCPPSLPLGPMRIFRMAMQFRQPPPAYFQVPVFPSIANNLLLFRSDSYTWWVYKHQYFSFMFYISHIGIPAWWKFRPTSDARYSQFFKPNIMTECRHISPPMLPRPTMRNFTHCNKDSFREPILTSVYFFL